MSSSTPNINLTLPDGGENVSRQTINDNYTKIDTEFGTQSQAIANVNPAKTTILSSANVTSDTSIMSLVDGVYQVASPTSINAYLPSSYGTLIVNKSGNSYGVFTFVGTSSRIWIRSAANSTTWHTGWVEITPNKTEGTVEKANCTGTYNGVKFERTANFVKVIIHGFSSLANGSTEICNVPSGFYSSVSGDACDIMVPSNNDGTGVRTIRFSITNTGKLTAYNYGLALTNNNAETSAFFIIG